MIDIHCHLLYGVDDGAADLEESIAMLQQAQNQGITDIVLTPHYRHGMFAYPQKEITAHFEELLPYAEMSGIRIYLGTEYHVNSHIVEAFGSGRCQTLAGTRYVLTEYAHHSDYRYMQQMTQELLLHGYYPIIAHIERYACIADDYEKAAGLQEMGAWIQVNADAVLGMEGWAAKRLCRALLREGWVDVIASDSHGIHKRACHLKKCLEYVSKKYSEDYAGQLFEQNPRKMILAAAQH